jgi:hypothetical protein
VIRRPAPTLVLGQEVRRRSDGAVGRISRLGGTHAEITWTYDNTSRSAYKPQDPLSPKVTNVALTALHGHRFELGPAW